MSASFFVYLGVGKLLIFLGQKFIVSNSQNGFIRRLFECDMCLGFWIYTILALAFRVVIFQDIYGYVPLISEIITGAVSTFAVHLLTLGWKTKFFVEVI